MIVVPACTVCVAPSGGRVRPFVRTGEVVDRGDVVAAIDRDGRSEPVRAPRPGMVGGALTGPRQQVVKGEGILWLVR